MNPQTSQGSPPEMAYPIRTVTADIPVIPAYPDGRINTVNAAKMIGLSVKTLATMRCTGTGPAYQKIRGRIYYRLDSVREWIQRHPEQVSTAQTYHMKLI